MRRVAFMLLCVTVFTIPWEAAVRFEGFGALTRLLGYAALLAAVLAVIIRGRVKSLRLFHVLVLAVVVWNCFTVFWTVNVEASVDRGLTYVSLLLFVWMIWELVESPADQRALLQTIILGCYVAIADLVAAVLAGAPAGIHEYRYTGGGVNQNDLALTLAVCVPISQYLYGTTEGRSRLFRAADALFWPAAGFAIIMTGSRTGLICFGAASLVTLLWGFRGRLRMRILISVIVVAGLAAAFMLLPEDTSARLMGITHEIEQGSWGERLPIYAAGFRTFWEHPILGIGTGAFAFGIGAALLGWPAHDTYLSVLVECGLVGFGLFLWLLGVLSTAVWRLPLRAKRSWQAALLTWAIGVMTLSWEYHKMTWFLFAAAMTQHWIETKWAGWSAPGEPYRRKEQDEPLVIDVPR